MRASYRFGVQWIAENDEPDSLDHAEVCGYISTLLLADLFGKDPADVAKAIVRKRKALLAQERFETTSARIAAS